MLFLAHIHRTSKRAPRDVDVLARIVIDATIHDWQRALHASSVSQSTESGSPPREKLRALPFATSLAQAQETYAHFHRHNWFLSQITPTAEHVKEVYMPWWVVGAHVHVSVDSAQVGTLLFFRKVGRNHPQNPTHHQHRQRPACAPLQPRHTPL